MATAIDAESTTLTDHDLPCRHCGSDTLDELARRELSVGIDRATYAAQAYNGGSLFVLADAARTIRDALAAIEPIRDGDSIEWTAAVRKAALSAAITRAGLQRTWTPDTLNQACTTALAITAGREPWP